MSLECEGATGASCMECGHFVFLPTACPRCEGLFCHDHIMKHQRHRGESDSHHEHSLWCSASDVAETAKQQSSLSRSTDETSAKTTTMARRCVVCDSEWCVLTPCTKCLKNYCAAHRFHGHEEEESAAAGRSKRGVHEGNHNKRPLSSSPSNDDSHLQSVCAPFVSATPLVLAPPGYKSRMMDLLAILASPPPPRDSHEDGDDSSPWTFGLCSLSVAVEATLGQMMQRCFCQLGLADVPGAGAHQMESPALQALCASSAMYEFSTTKELATTEATSGARGSLALPPVALQLLMPSAITKEALLPGAAMVLYVGSAAGAVVSPQQQEANVAHAVRDALFSKQSDVSRDARVKAVATRLHLAHRQRLTTSVPNTNTNNTAPSSPTLLAYANDNDGSQEGVGTGDDDERADVSEVTASADPAAQWPLRTPPPLTDVNTFAGSKSSPLGVKALAGAPRVTVAVLVEDVHLPQAVPTCCIAVGKNWTVGKITNRIREEVCEAAKLPPAQHSALFKAYTLYVLNTAHGNTTGARALVEEGPAGLQHGLVDGDVLFYGRCGSHGAVNPLIQAEVERATGLAGKEKMALHMKRMKQCTVM